MSSAAASSWRDSTSSSWPTTELGRRDVRAGKVPEHGRGRHATTSSEARTRRAATEREGIAALCDAGELVAGGHRHLEAQRVDLVGSLVAERVEERPGA